MVVAAALDIVGDDSCRSLPVAAAAAVGQRRLLGGGGGRGGVRQPRGGRILVDLDGEKINSRN